MNGATPVPAPIIIIESYGFSGILKLDSLKSILTLILF